MNKNEQLNKINDELVNLTESPLYQYRINNDYQPVVGEGDINAEVLFIGEAPGKTEAETGRPFCGASGRILDELLDSIGWDRDTVYITNVVKDRPPENRDPTASEIALYTPFLNRQIDIIKPYVVATLGRFAMEFMFVNYSNNLPLISRGKNAGQPKIPKISDAHGNIYSLQTNRGTNFKFIPLFHPAVALYNPNNKTDLLTDFKLLPDVIKADNWSPNWYSKQMFDQLELLEDYQDLPTEWQMKELFGYDSYHDPQIEKDIKKGIRELKKFAKKWSGREDWLQSISALKEVLDEYFVPTSAVKPLYYLGLLTTKNTEDSELQALDAKYSEQVSQAAEACLFFELGLGKVDKSTQKKFLKSPTLSDYKFWLQELFADAKYDLSQAEERIISRYSRPKYGLWIESLQKSLNKKTVNWRGKELGHAEVAAMVGLEHNTARRRSLNNKLFDLYAELEDTAEGAMNAILLNRKISNDLRGYRKPYSATVRSYQNTEREVEDLVSVVRDNYKIVHQFYRFKQRVMELDDFTYADRNVDVGRVSAEYSYGDSIAVIDRVLNKFNRECSTTFQRMVSTGHYDVYPSVGKRGGAYHASTTDQPGVVFLNHVDGFNEMMTIAHETGHALHSNFSKTNQPYQYQGYTTSTAEVASTFFENLVFYDQLPDLSPQDQFVALMAKMNNGVNTIHRQIALFEIERQLHEHIKDSGHVSAAHMKDILLSEFRNHLGKSVEVDDKIGNFVHVMTQAHFASPFYVYSYAYGEMIARALHEVYLSDNVQGTEAVINFMSAGSSAKPKDIFRKSGIKVGVELWEDALEAMKADLRKLKRLHRKLNK